MSAIDSIEKLDGEYLNKSTVSITTIFQTREDATTKKHIDSSVLITDTDISKFI